MKPKSLFSLPAVAALLALPSMALAGIDGTPDTVADWQLMNNTSGGNSFAKVGNTISGTFAARPSAAGWALDTTLDPAQTGADGRLTDNQDFFAEGTFSFSNPNNTDPNFFWGFYDSPATPNDFATNRLFGFGLADQVAGQYRIQGFVGGTALGNLATLSNGTYRFEISYIAANDTATLRIENTSGVLQGVQGVRTNYAAFSDFNTFGLTQDDGAAPATHQFTLGPLEYTGGTNIPEPGTLSLALLTAAGMLCSRRRRVS